MQCRMSEENHIRAFFQGNFFVWFVVLLKKPNSHRKCLFALCVWKNIRITMLTFPNGKK